MVFGLKAEIILEPFRTQHTVSVQCSYGFWDAHREMDLALERNTYLTKVLILFCLFSHILEEKYSKTKINYDQS